MTQRQIIYVRALDCTKSPDNVRTSSDPAADAELEANIGETGEVIQNLVGLAVPRKKGKFEIFAGGRRLERVHANIEKGVLAEDFMVPVFPAKNRQEAISMSLAENYYNLRMLGHVAKTVLFVVMRGRPTAALTQRAGGGRPAPRIAQRCLIAA